jgi:hypothetical protein
MKHFQVEVKKQRGWVVVFRTYDAKEAGSVAKAWTCDGYQVVISEKRG